MQHLARRMLLAYHTIIRLLSYIFLAWDTLSLVGQPYFFLRAAGNIRLGYSLHPEVIHRLTLVYFRLGISLPTCVWPYPRCRNDQLLYMHDFVINIS